MEKTKTKKIMITGGHLTPALAVLNALQAQNFSNIVWIGNKHSQTSGNNLSAEFAVITGRGVRFINFTAGKIWRRWTLATFTKGIYNLLLIPAGFVKAFFIIRQERPDIIVSFGGYLALPLVIAGKILRRKTVTHEQTIVVGLANKIISRFADKIMVSWPESAKFFPREKTVITGNPLRPEIFHSNTSILNFPGSLPVIYVTGGNQGANTINWRLLKILPAVLKQANIIHQTGNSSLTNDFDNANAAKKTLPVELQSRYLVFANIFAPEIGEVMDRADLLVSRSGANTICEILAMGKLAILVPLPWSSGKEQLANAKIVAQTGLGLILQQYDDMPPEILLEYINRGLTACKNRRDFLNRPLNEARKAAGKLVNRDAAKKISGEIIRLLEE